MDLANKRILVTGSTGGIGTELCRLLNERGAKLILTCYNEELLARQRAELGVNHLAVTAQIDTSAGREEIVSACQHDGGIDGVINLAGILDFDLFEQQSTNTIARIVNINLTAAMLLTHELIPILREKSEAALLNVGSIFASIGHPGFVSYCASKAGVKCFTEALARELSDTSIRISYIAPRATSTSLNSDSVNALNKALGNNSDSPAYVAKQIVEILEKNKRLRYLGWPEKLFVRVNALFPSVIDGALGKKLDVIKQYSSQ